jgi:type II secretory pathway predicted ATPase ExeA
MGFVDCGAFDVNVRIYDNNVMCRPSRVRFTSLLFNNLRLTWFDLTRPVPFRATTNCAYKCNVDDDSESRPALADDPSFIASLGDLDRGLGSEAGDESPADAARPANRPKPRRDGGAPATAAARPPLIDSLSELDRGLAIESDELAASDQIHLIPELPPITVQGPPAQARAIADRPSAQPRQPRPAPLASSPQSAAPPPAGGPAHRRPLIDLFPPSPSEDEGAASHREGPSAETFYGLHEKPFSPSPDPRFLFHSASHDRAVQALHDAIQRRDPLIIVTGERGVGKTMLCRSFVQQIDRRTLTSLLSDPSVSIGDLLRTVLVDVGVVSTDDLTRGPLTNASHQQLTATLRSFLDSLAGLKATAVVIFDDAHRLSEDVLDYLATLAGLEGVSQVLQLVLVGRPSLPQTLRRSRLKSLARTARPVPLTPLQAEEIAGYVAHRLAVAGGSPRVEFDEAALRRVFERTGGVPRLVDVICERALSIGHAASASVIEPRLIDAAAQATQIAPPASGLRRIARTAAGAVVLMLLTLVGAIGALVVFQQRVALIVTHWHAIPPSPGGPVPQVRPPLAPLPPPS